MGLVPLSVRCAVDEHNTVLHQGLGTDQFIVGCIIDDINYSCLACTTLRAPGEAPHVQPQGSVLLVASPHTDCVYAAGANLCVGSRASQLILPLLVVGLSLAPGLTALVPIVPRDAHRSAMAGKSDVSAFNTLSTFVIAFLPSSKCFNFVAAVTISSDFGTQENKICHFEYKLNKQGDNIQH